MKCLGNTVFGQFLGGCRCGDLPGNGQLEICIKVFLSQKMMASLGENDQILLPFCFHAQNTSSRSGYPDIPYYVCLHCDLLAHLIFNENEINLSKMM